jgi:hypothetical protein
VGRSKNALDCCARSVAVGYARRVPAPDLGDDPRLARRRLRVSSADVVWLRSILEGYDNLAALYGDGTGVVVVTAPQERADELDALLADLATEAQLCALDDGEQERCV